MRLLMSRSQVGISELDDFFLLTRGLFLVFIIALYRAAFCRVLTSACEGKLRLCVKGGHFLLSKSTSVKATKNVIFDFFFRFPREKNNLHIDSVFSKSFNFIKLVSIILFLNFKEL